jgi:hypothetical protein
MYDPDNKSYTLLLDEQTGKTTIRPVLADASSKLYINGRKVSSKTFTLANAKQTKVTIKVQPKTGKANTYTVILKRAASTNASLAYIKASKGSFAKVDSANYTVNLSNTQTSTKISTCILQEICMLLPVQITFCLRQLTITYIRGTALV